MIYPTPVSERLYSLDALRGFDMLWIMGAEGIISSLAETTGAPFWQGMAQQLEHAGWNGFRFEDLIFPLFLFIAGVATPYSVGRQLEKGINRSVLLFHVVKRGLLLVLLGIIYNNGLQLAPLYHFRFPSVLGRIGWAYLFANIIYLYTKERGQKIIFISLLIGYWLLLLCTSAPGYPMGDLSMPGNFVSYIDRSILPGRLYLGIHDPEGILSTIPAIATGLLGIFAGNLLKHGTCSGTSKALRLAVTGSIFIIIAQMWNTIFPINKNLWTSSFVLQVGGISLLLLATFYYIIDVLGYKKWAFFFTVIGMNSILIYMSGCFIDWEFSTKSLFGWLFQLAGDPSKIVLFPVCFVLVKWLLLYFLYKNKIFLRV